MGMDHKENNQNKKIIRRPAWQYCIWPAFLIRLCGKTALQYLVGYLSLTIPLFTPTPPEVGTRVLFCVFAILALSW